MNEEIKKGLLGVVVDGIYLFYHMIYILDDYNII